MWKICFWYIYVINLELKIFFLFFSLFLLRASFLCILCLIFQHLCYLMYLVLLVLFFKLTYICYRYNNAIMLENIADHLIKFKSFHFLYFLFSLIYISLSRSIKMFQYVFALIVEITSGLKGIIFRNLSFTKRF